jgi:hypothetical protein
MSEKKSENFPEFSTVNGKARALIFSKSQKFSKVSALVRVVYKVTKDIVYKVSSVQSHQRQYCSVQCTVYSVQVTKDSALQCTVYSVQSHQRQYCSVQCSVQSHQRQHTTVYTVYSVQSHQRQHTTVYSVQCTVYSVQCSVQSHQRQHTTVYSVVYKVTKDKNFENLCLQAGQQKTFFVCRLISKNKSAKTKISFFVFSACRRTRFFSLQKRFCFC